MIKSIDIEKMSDVEFDIFQREERKDLCKQLGDEYEESNDITLKCGKCNTTFIIVTYTNAKCPGCGRELNAKQSLIDQLRLTENIINSINNN